MERKLLKRFRTITVFVSFLFVLVFAACEIGLGSSVDTEPPTLTITYPSADVVIRDAFVLAGSCNDDEALDTVTVLLKETATNTSYGPFEIQIPEREEGDKSAQDWKIWLNQKDNGLYPFKDGRYVAEVYATDKSGKVSGKSSLSFDIDNTAPIFVVQTPVAIDLTQPTEFGSSVKANGRIADDHTISKMVMKVYDASANFDDVNNLPVAKYEFTETEVETAGGTSVVFAKYNKSEASSTDTSAKSGRYNVLNNGQPWFCSIEVVDAAKTYTQSESDATSEGNSTGGAMYRYDDVYDVWLSAACGLDTTAVKQIVNGTYSGTASAASIEAAKKAYEKYAKSNVCFSVNPVVNPKYTCFGYTVGKDINRANATMNKVSGGSTLSVNVNCGLDGTLLNPRSTTIYIFGPFSSLTEEDITSIYSKPSGYTGTLYKKWTINDLVDLQSKESCESFVESVTLPSEIDNDSYYVLAAEVYDVEGMVTIPETWIVFKGYVQEKIPVIEWKSAGSIPSTIKAESNFATCDEGGFFNITEPKDLTFYGLLSGVDKLDAIDSTSFKYSVTYENENLTEGESYVSGNIVKDAAVTLLDDYYVITTVDSSGKTIEERYPQWRFTIPKETIESIIAADSTAPASGREYSVKISVDVSTKKGVDAVPVTRKIHVDNKSPVVKINAVKPFVADDENNNCLNGNVGISGIVTDTNLEKYWYEIFIDDVKKYTSVQKALSYAFDFDFDTTAYDDNSNINVIVYAKDKGGNVGSISTTKFNSNTAFLINQETDRPKLELTNGEVNLLDYNALSVSNNVFGTVSNNTMTLSITDDDGIKSVKVEKHNKKDVDPNNWSEILSENLEGTTSKTVLCELGSDKGEYKIRVTIKDI